MCYSVCCRITRAPDMVVTGALFYIDPPSSHINLYIYPHSCTSTSRWQSTSKSSQTTQDWRHHKRDFLSSLQEKSTFGLDCLDPYRSTHMAQRWVIRLGFTLPVKLIGKRWLWHSAHVSVSVHWLLLWHMHFPGVDTNLMTLKLTLKHNVITLPETAKGFEDNIKKCPFIGPLCVGHAWPLLFLQCIHSHGEWFQNSPYQLSCSPTSELCSIPMGKRYSQIQWSSLSLGSLQCMSMTGASRINVLCSSHAVTSMKWHLRCFCLDIGWSHLWQEAAVQVQDAATHLFQWMLRTKSMLLQISKINGEFCSPTQMEIVLQQGNSSQWFNNYLMWDVEIALALLIGCLLWHCLDFWLFPWEEAPCEHLYAQDCGLWCL